ncbi:hypothetical protein [Janthinobacterium sp. 17J80-10]|uniref:hypothetical protein n=1 Tax=Janthinobacterium sp. 17J80-10 TaxID=2497863 RepID=UPI00100536E7|nr:hypothetical protein [Janthinobacterium sp. 17J80-10]QAU34866.1 hypothetical protein EKL02_12105 [Janthinobacterium sp. 17J80-10]
MLTGTPLDLTPFGAVLQGIGILYWLLVIAALALVLIKVKGRLPKVLSVIAVLAIMIGPVALHVLKKHEQQQQTKARLNAAMAHFQMRCKKSGEKIEHTVENVDGVMWMKWREKNFNQSDQFTLNDPYGQDCGGEDCILKLLRATDGLDLDPKRQEPYHKGFSFIESVDPQDGQLYRYTLRLYRPHDRDAEWLETLIRPELLKESIEKTSVRYGITWDDISTREDREQWIAGGSLKVIDLQANKVIAERTGYMIDRGQGSKSGFRSPWPYAQQTACPSFPEVGPFDPRRRKTGLETLNFVQKILKP